MSKSNADKLAVASFILGISSFCLGPFSGIPTMILASLAYRRIKRNGTYGKNLAIASWIMGAIPTLLVMIPLFWPHKDRLGMRIDCHNNLKKIGTAMLMYAGDNDDWYPPYDGAKGLDVLRREGYLSDPGVFICPDSDSTLARKGEPLTEDNVSYIYKGGYNSDKKYIDTPILWDKPGNHENESRTVLFGGGHVKRFLIEDDRK